MSAVSGIPKSDSIFQDVGIHDLVHPDIDLGLLRIVQVNDPTGNDFHLLEFLLIVIKVLVQVMGQSIVGRNQIGQSFVGNLA